MDETPVHTEETVTVSSTLPPQDVVTSTTTVVPPPGVPNPTQKVFQKKKKIFRAYQIIWFLLAVIEILLAFRMLLKALGSDPKSGFATLIYALSDPLALPFTGLVGITQTQTSTFDWSIIIAAAVYALLTFGIVQIIHMSKPVSKQEVEQTVDEA
ncbi:MAG TPA: hypothetical protein VM077_02825 [Candidatus Limnocylindrales bacterium]|nr:hypothetical protein [Candidatus Limnocylindrales bacterium]